MILCLDRNFCERAEWLILSVKGIEERALGHLPTVTPIGEVRQDTLKPVLSENSIRPGFVL
jgi:hypothetical protein